MSNPIFEGSCVALITPFKDNKIDYDKLHELIDFHIANGTDALLVAGTTGEASTLSDEEHRALLTDAGKYINGRIPYIAGTGSNDTAYSIGLTKHAQDNGADAVLIINPYYNKSTQKGIYEHIKTIAESTELPIIIYNVPSRTGANITPDTVVALSEIDNIVGIKEASGNISQISEISRRTPEDFIVYSGNDDQALPVIAVGGKGVISVTANIAPKEVHEMAMAAVNGDYDKARELQFALDPLNNALFLETNPIPVKKAMELMKIDTGEMRLPLVEMSEGPAKVLEQELKDYGLLKD